MKSASSFLLIVQAVYELLRYDGLHWVGGFRAVFGELPPTQTLYEVQWQPEDLHRAVERTAIFYPKRVQCLQRSIVLGRLMRRHGFAAELIVGYRPDPFSSHAWIELEGRVVNDSGALKRTMLVLDRLAAPGMAAK